MSAIEKKAGVRRQRKPDADVTERLLKDETVLKTAIISDFIYWRSVAVLIIAIIVALFLAIELGVLLAVVAFVMAAHATILKSILMMVVTNKRIMMRYGILQVDVVDIHFDKVESVELDRMLTGYLMGYSNVVVMGTGNRYSVIPFVENGVEIRRAFNEMTLNRSSEAPPIPVVVIDESKAQG